MTKRSSTITLASRFDRAGGRPSGFDYLRLSLALVITAYHTIPICFGTAFEETLWQPGHPLRAVFSFFVPMFFALSGFLVARSLLTNAIPGFLTLRAARIFPALICVVLFSALIIGPLLTTDTLRGYFADREFYTYLLNAPGFIHYSLPGLFLGNPFPDTVNIQLWTIPYELQCYILLTLLAVLRVVQKPRLFLLAFCGISFLAFAYSAFWAGFDLTRTAPSGRTLILSFGAGTLLYVWRERIPHSRVLFVISLISAALLFEKVQTGFFAALPVAYVTVYLGLLNPRRLPVVAKSDYSYGIYLYGFVIQQAILQAVPMGQVWYINLALSIVATWFAAYLSWNLLEKRVLGAKRHAVKVVNTFANHIGRMGKAIVPRTVFRLWDWALGFGDVFENGLARMEKAALKLKP